MIYDEEDLLRSIKEYVQDNLNTKITAINTAKGDFNIDTITADDDHYVFAGELLELPNNNFVQFAIDGEIEVKNNRNDKISIPVFMIEVAFDDPKDSNTYFKSLRYMRAMYEVMLNYEASTNEVDGLLITKVAPMVVKLRGRQLVISGVTVSAAIG